MDKDFWDEKWKLRQIGFHQSKVHNQLTGQFNSLFKEHKPKSAFIPLCGKSLDIIWLSEQCNTVVGIEFNRTAIEEFFKENDLEIEERGSINGMPYFKCGNITIIEGDIFEYSSPSHEFDFIYDRAAIVALAPQTRNKYQEKLLSLSSTNCIILLIAFEYDQDKVSGPPFSVSEKEIKELFFRDYSINLIHEKNEVPRSPKFVEAKVTSFKQKTYSLNRSS